MFGALARRLFGSANDRYVKSLGPIVSAINELEPELESMSDEELRARTQRFKQQLADGRVKQRVGENFESVREELGGGVELALDDGFVEIRLQPRIGQLGERLHALAGKANEIEEAAPAFPGVADQELGEDA